MRNVTVKYYRTSDMLMEDMANCARCKVYTKCDWHHTKTRSRGGVETTPLCRVCHDWVGNHPAEANKLGLYEYGYNTDGDRTKTS